ncbi:MAG: D-tyrosyl-tRNA(Tyr) deacylase [Spirochaetales bacterium]|nr:D-tyrosyl-tRNA(Tyr) deacylase [Spirochaetales bacterium]
MKAVIQRVAGASVTIEKETKRTIGPGLLILLGVGKDDTEADGKWLANKIAKMRIFQDTAGKMNLSVLDKGGEAMVISQFTLFADTNKGNRPSFNGSGTPETAIPLYEKFTAELSAILEKPVPTGEFGAHMDVELINDGPVTIMMDTKEGK